MKLLPVLSLASATILSCAKPASNGHEEFVKTYFGYFNEHNWAKMAEMYTEVAEFKDPSLGPGIIKQTRQQTIEKYTGLASMFPNVRDSIVQIYPSGENHVIVEFISTGISAEDGKPFELPICTIFTIENGKISKDFTYYDN